MSGGIKINIRNNFPEVARALDRVGEDVGNKAMARALNTTVAQGKTAMASQISKEFRIKVADAKDRLDVSKARYKGSLRLEVVLYAKRPYGLYGNSEARGMNLIRFVTTAAKRNKKGKLGQLQFQIKRAGGRKSIKGAFIATNRKTNGTSVFIREGKDRMPIRPLTTIDVQQMFNTKRINSVVREVMLKRFSTNFQRELRSVLKGYVK